jgi:hypothetical protein
VRRFLPPRCRSASASLNSPASAGLSFWHVAGRVETLAGAATSGCAAKQGLARVLRAYLVMKQRRPRQAVDRAAKIFLGGSDGLPGRICNISEGGAKVCIAASRWVPYGFDLQDVFSGVRRKVRVVWRGPAGMGVCFVDVGDWPRRYRPVEFGRR